MVEIAYASINNFVPVAGQSNVQHSEPIFVLTGSQLKETITKAIQPLQDEVRDLKNIVANLESKVSALERTQDTQGENEVNLLRIINDLRKDKEPQPLQTKGSKTIARIAKIDEILKARGATTLKELERILKISPKEMNRLMAKLDMRRYEVHVRLGDEREKVLRLKLQIRWRQMSNDFGE